MIHDHCSAGLIVLLASLLLPLYLITVNPLRYPFAFSFLGFVTILRHVYSPCILWVAIVLFHFSFAAFQRWQYSFMYLPAPNENPSGSLLAWFLVSLVNDIRQIS